MMNKTKIQDIAVTALFAAIISVSAIVTVPMPGGVPMTLQTAAVALCGYCLGTKKSLWALGTYILLGICGAPVFSGFMSGPGVLAGKTGGFIIGFIFIAIGCSLGVKTNNRLLRILLGISGLLACHLLGITWYMQLTKGKFFACAAAVSLPFLLKDIICTAAAAIAAESIIKVSKKIKI